MRHKLALAGLLAAGCLLVLPAASGAAADKTTWLCRPGLRSNPCQSSLTATVLDTAGGSKIERRRNARRAPIDCFYVYPTVSDQQTINADLSPDPEIRATANFQAARFSQVCKVWAPIYRQITLVGISDPNKVTAAARAKAYKSLRSGWHEYLAKHNHGRPFVLLGHSQGTFVLRRLIADEIDRRPALRRRMVSALLLGGDVTVRKGRDAGGDFKNVPACRSAAQTGCVVAYSMFGETPPADARFGRAADSKHEVLCTNPSSLRGGTATLQPYVPTTPFPGTIGLGIRIFTGELPAVQTPWLVPAGRYSARCATAAGASFLKVTAHDGAHVPTPTPNPGWGYHLGDVNLALGNLTALVKVQSAAYRRTHR